MKHNEIIAIVSLPSDGSVYKYFFSPRNDDDIFLMKKYPDFFELGVDTESGKLKIMPKKQIVYEIKDAEKEAEKEAEKDTET